MHFLKEKVSNDDFKKAKGFLTTGYFFYRRDYDGEWNCISSKFGNQTKLDKNIVISFFNKATSVFYEGDKMGITF